jgi:hypothetical protein
MNRCEKRTWLLITIVIALIMPSLFVSAFKLMYQYINPIGIEIAPNAQIKQMSVSEKEDYLLTLLYWDQKFFPILMYAMIILATIALLFGIFFTRNIYLKVGLVVLSLSIFGLAYFYYLARLHSHTTSIIQRLESKKSMRI